MTTIPTTCAGVTINVCGRTAAFVLAAVCTLHAGSASAATIAPGSPIILAPDVLVVPITITDGANVEGWSFDLRYDPLDLQVNAACDPFSGDVYCSLFTGPVTEGDFFATGSPFNLLNPGFIELDATTLAQTGLLFAVNGAYGGFPPGPSGDGVLAYVEFLKVGRGPSDVTVENPSVTEAPEPATLALLATGLLLSPRRWRRRIISHERTR
jgi:hypothetical protein